MESGTSSASKTSMAVHDFTAFIKLKSFLWAGMRATRHLTAFVILASFMLLTQHQQNSFAYRKEGGT